MHRLPFESRDVFKKPLDADELRALALKAGGAREIFSWRSPSARRLVLDAANTPAVTLIELMAVEPRLIRRPIVVSGETILVGADAKALEAALGHH